MDGEHKAWMVVEVESKEQARLIVPPAFRPQTRVIALSKFSMEQVENILRQHGKR